jgi:diguanylate cyclase (GGDEF)-like protein/putative nucleotidyltransferase with HDIG domain
VEQPAQGGLQTWQDIRAKAIDDHLDADRRRVGERLAERFRWLFLAVLAILNNFGGFSAVNSRVFVNLLLVAWAIANGGIAYLLERRAYQPQKRFSLATVALDVVFGAALVYLSNGFESPYFLAFFLVIIASAVRFGTTASLLAALAISFIYLFIGAIGPVHDFSHDAQLGLSGIGKIFLFVVVALATGLMSREMERERRLAVARAAQADALREMSVNMASSLDIKDVFEAVLQHGLRMTGASSGQVVLVFEDGVQVAASRDETGYEVEDELFRQVAHSGAPSFPDERKTIVAAVASGDGVTAVLRLCRQKSFGNDDLFTVNALAGSAAVPLANALHYSRSAQEAVTDGLTGLLNHREFRRRLEAELIRHEGPGRQLSVLLIDIDRFKAVNDTMGHQHGDEVIKEAARVVRRTARIHDLVARYGGDELAVIGMDSSAEGAAALAERLVDAVRAARIATIPGQFLTFSIGVATYPHDALGVEELVMAADQALYLAKRDGRDRAQTFPRLVERLESSQQELVTALDQAGPQVVVAVGHAIDHHNPLTYGHSSRVAALAEALARRSGYPPSDLERLRAIAFIHDIGTLSLDPNSPLHDGVPAPEAIDAVRTHPIAGEELVRKAPLPAEVAAAVRHHHERWDGKGYPDGLTGQAIPIEARLVALADAFEALTAGRGLAGPLLPSEALARIESELQGAFDPDLVQVLRVLVEESAVSVPLPAPPDPPRKAPPPAKEVVGQRSRRD